MKKAAALPAVLFTLSLASALSVGGVFVARQLAAGNRHGQSAAMLQEAAEQALVESLVSWDTLQRGEQTVGFTATLAQSEIGSTRTETWITRFSSTGYWIVAEARFRRESPLTRRVGLLVSAADSVPRTLRPRAWGELP